MTPDPFFPFSRVAFSQRDHAAATRVTNDVGAFLRNHANGRAQGTNEGSVSSTHCVSPLLLQTTRDTKLLPVVQLRSGVILLMGANGLILFSRFGLFRVAINPRLEQHVGHGQHNRADEDTD